MELPKISVVLFFLLILAFQSAAQPASKKPKDKTPSQKEMEALMKEAQEALDELSPEEKRMMDSLGIKRPDFKKVSGFSDKQLMEVFDDENRLVPQKDPARIAVINKKPLSDGELKTFITNTRAVVEKKLTTIYTIPGQKIYDSIKAKHASDNAVAAVATGFWISGNPELAVYLMGKSCEDHPAEPDNLNNYSAFLSMLGGEQYALPISYTLNKKYPKNSTILNNIGQAWFGLGDMDQAMRYLDSAIMIYPRHSQAHYTESVIEESRGHKEAAIEHLMKSNNESFSEEKVNKLSKLGKKLKAADISWKLPKPYDALGLSRYNLPPFPKSTTEARKMKPGLDQFYEDIRAEIQELNEKAEKYSSEEDEKEAKVMNDDNPVKYIKYLTSKINHGPLYAKAMFLYNDYYSDPALLREHERLMTDLINVLEENAAASSALSDVLAKAGGVGFDTDASVAICNKINSEFLSKANTKLEDKYTKYLNFQRIRQNNLAYYMGFIAPPESAEAVQSGYKAHFLQELIEFECETDVVCPAEVLKDSVISGKLLDYDSLRNDTLACLKFFSFFEMRVMADRTYTKWDFSIPLEGISIGIKGELEQNDNLTGVFGVGRITKGTLEFGASMGTGDKVDWGPAKAEAKINGGGFIDFSEDGGVSDFGIKAGVGIKTGVGDKDIKSTNDSEVIKSSGLGKSITVIGVETKIGWNVSKGFLSSSSNPKSFLLK